MDIFKQASRQKLRIQTSKGNLSVEQLWDLSLEELDTIAVHLEKEYNESKGKSFLSKKTTKDKDIKLQFDVALEILESKALEAQAAKAAKERKERNQKIMSIIAEKKDDALSKKSIRELEEMLDED